VYAGENGLPVDRSLKKPATGNTPWVRKGGASKASKGSTIRSSREGPNVIAGVGTAREQGYKPVENGCRVQVGASRDGPV